MRKCLQSKHFLCICVNVAIIGIRITLVTMVPKVIIVTTQTLVTITKMITFLTKVIIHVHRSSCKVSVIFCLILTGLWICQQILVKIPISNVMKNPSGRSQVVLCELTYRHDKANGICCVNTLKNGPSWYHCYVTDL